MRATPALLLAVLAGVAADADAELVSGRAAATVDGEELAFAWRVMRCDGQLRTEWRDAAGRVVAAEQLEYDAGGVRRYRIDRPPLAQGLEVQRAQRVLEIRSRSAGTSTRVQVEVDGAQQVLAGPMLVAYVLDAIDLLRAGKALQVRYLLPERATVVELQLLPVSDGALGGLRVAIRPASIWLRPFMPRTELEFRADGRFVEMTGPLLPMAGSGAQPVPLQGLLSGIDRRPTSDCHIGSIT